MGTFVKSSDRCILPCPKCGAEFEFFVERLDRAWEQYTLDFLWNCKCWESSSSVEFFDKAFKVGKKNLHAKESANPFYWLALQVYQLWWREVAERYYWCKRKVADFKDRRRTRKANRLSAEAEKCRKERWGNRKD